MAKVTDEQIKEMLRLRRQGRPIGEIAEAVGCHRQTVRAYLRERQSSILADEAKKDVLKELLLEHYKELADFASKELISRFRYSLPEGSHALVGVLGLPGLGSPLYTATEWERLYKPASRVNKLTEALREHTQGWLLWDYWPDWEGVVIQYRLTSGDFRDWIVRKTEVPEIFLVVNRDALTKIQGWLFGNVLRLASGEPYKGLEVVRVKGREELRDNGTVVAQVDDGKALCERLAGILKEAQELDLLKGLQEAMRDLKEKHELLQDISLKVISELEAVGMKRGFPGSCFLCPI